MTAAMVFLIEATTACGPVAPARLGGGAEVVRAVLEFEEEASVASVASVATLTGLNQSNDSPETHEPDFDPASVPCRVVPIVIA